MALHSTARSAVRQYTARLLNDLLTGTVASPGSGTFTVEAWAGYLDDYFNHHVQVYDYSGTGAGTSGKPSDWVQSTYTMTFVPAATLTAADLVEVHRTWMVAEYNDAINLAIENVKSEVLTMETDTSLILDDILTNGNFDSGYNSTWTTGGTGTFSNEATLKLRGTYAAKAINTASNAAYYTQSYGNYPYYIDKNVTGGAWCYCTTTSRVRVAVTDGDDTTYSDYHSGDGWELLKAYNHHVSEDATELTIQLRIETGTAITAYWDEAFLSPDEHIYQYTIPSDFVYIHKLEMESDNVDVYTTPVDDAHWRIAHDSINKIEFAKNLWSPTSGRLLRISGLQVPSTLSADATTTGISPVYLAYQTAAYLHASRIRNSDGEDHGKQFSFWQQKADIEKVKIRTSLPPGSRKVYA